MNTKFHVEIPEWMSEKDADLVESVVTGAYPHVIGEWDGDRWELDKNPESSMEDFLREKEEIRLTGARVVWEDYTDVNPTGRAPFGWHL